MKRLSIIICTILAVIVLSYQPPQRGYAAPNHITPKVELFVLDKTSVSLIAKYDSVIENDRQINKLIKDNENTSYITNR